MMNTTPENVARDIMQHAVVADEQAWIEYAAEVIEDVRAAAKAEVLAGVAGYPGTSTRTKIHQPEDVIPSARGKTTFPYLDEFVATGVNVHFESMSHAQFWIGITRPGGRMWHINCGAVNDNAKGYAHIDEIEPQS